MKKDLGGKNPLFTNKMRLLRADPEVILWNRTDAQEEKKKSCNEPGCSVSMYIN